MYNQKNGLPKHARKYVISFTLQLSYNIDVTIPTKPYDRLWFFFF
jgi:hypothetical protein